MLFLKTKDLTIYYDASIKNKKTARCPEQYVGHDEQGNRYLVVFARTETQRFYVKRAIENQNLLVRNFPEGMKWNTPLYYEENEEGICAVYRYYEDAKEVRDERALLWIKEYYDTTGEAYCCTEELIGRIEADFLSAWPSEYHETIKCLDKFCEFHKELKKYDRLVISGQHGDYTPNNILDVSGQGLFLMDFEFSQQFQPIGFDLYDYCYSSHKKVDDIPYESINRIKEDLQNEINAIVDRDHLPVIKEVALDYTAENKVVHWADQLIYNKPEGCESDNVKKVVITYGKLTYEIFYTIEKYKAAISVWMRSLPGTVLESLVDYIFKTNKFVIKIDINYSMTNCYNELNLDNQWIVFLPDKSEEIFDRLNKKSRSNVNRKKRLLSESLGELTYEEYTEKIPDEIINQYFRWKAITHGTDYRLTSEEYIRKYHVTGGLALRAGDKVVAVLFYCRSGDTVYLENLSYDSEFGKYSPGFILYEYFLERMTIVGQRTVFLGNGNQSYKTRFGAVEHMVYSGSVYRNPVFKAMNQLRRHLL